MKCENRNEYELKRRAQHNLYCYATKALISTSLVAFTSSVMLDGYIVACNSKTQHWVNLVI